MASIAIHLFNLNSLKSTVHTIAQSGPKPAGIMQLGMQSNQLYVNRKRASFGNNECVTDIESFANIIQNLYNAMQ